MVCAGLGSAGLTTKTLSQLRDLFQPKQMYDSIPEFVKETMQIIITLSEIFV